MSSFNTTSQIEERLVINATQRNIPLGGSFELLPLCNMDCKMCFLRLSPAQMQEQGRLRTADEWLSLASQAKEAGLLFLLLTGGEVFLYPEFERLYRELSRMGFYITINSNGTLIDEHIADLLQAHMPRRINITLYGASNATYEKLCGNPEGFTQTMHGLHLLLDRNIPVKLNGSLTAYNLDELEALQSIAKELDVPIKIDSYMFPSARKGVCGFDYSSRVTAREAAEADLKCKKGEMSASEYQAWMGELALAYESTVPAASICGADESYAPYVASADKTSQSCAPQIEHVCEPVPCRAGRSSFWINWKGNMTPCIFMEEPGVPVFDTGFAYAWEQIKKRRQQIYLPAACTKCERRKYCNVCSACALTETGNFCGKPDYMCTITNEKLRLAHAIIQNTP